MARVALVTGGTRGIGAAIAKKLKDEGYKAVVCDVVEDQLKAFTAETGIPGYKIDVSSHADVAEGVKKIEAEQGPIDILVNNAGITRDSLLPRMTDDQWVTVMQTNLNGCFFCTSAAIPFMMAQSFGRIVNITSLNGQVAATGQANYSASKGGVIAFTRTAATELARYGVTVNSVAPGYTDTDMFAAVPQAIQAQIKAKIPLGRFAHPHEIAKAVLFLVADGDYITGEQINVNGGAYDA